MKFVFLRCMFIALCSVSYVLYIYRMHVNRHGFIIFYLLKQNNKTIFLKYSCFEKAVIYGMSQLAGFLKKLIRYLKNCSPIHLTKINNCLLKGTVAQDCRIHTYLAWKDSRPGWGTSICFKLL